MLQIFGWYFGRNDEFILNLTDLQKTSTNHAVPPASLQFDMAAASKNAFITSDSLENVNGIVSFDEKVMGHYHLQNYYFQAGYGVLNSQGYIISLILPIKGMGFNQEKCCIL